MASEDRLQQRGSWGKWSEFLFAYLGSLIGFGNVWRFPYVCYMNGGGAFLLPFFVVVFVLGVPITFLEILYCQYSNYGPGRVWEVCPLFKGLGLCMMTMMSIVSVYYTMIMAWTLFYLVNSFRDPLPWASCDNEWNTENCTLSINDTLGAMSNVNQTSATHLSAAKVNGSWVSSAEEFWFKKAIEASPGIEHVGDVRWELVLCLLVAWFITFLCVVKGIKSLGKVAYVAASLPYVIMTSLLIRGCLLPGSDKGLLYFFVPRWDLLASFPVWRDAATQVFYSIGLGSGVISTLSSYNKFHNNCYRDALLMPLLDSFTSVFVGMVTFAYLGYTAHVTDKEMDDVVAQGPGLVFIAYPTALSTLPLPQLWSALFFIMLFTMGLDTEYVHVEVQSTAIIDCIPKLLPWKLLVAAMLCVVSFLLGIPFTTQGGIYILNLLDWYIASVCLLMIATIEILVLAWIYGTDNLYSDVEHMIGYRPPEIFKYCWKFVTPGLVMFLWVTGFIFFRPISEKLSGFNMASDIGGLAIAIFPVLALPVLAVWELSKRDGPLLTRIKHATKPSPLWRPAVYLEANADECEKPDTTV